MADTLALKIRAKKLGVLLRDARLVAGKSMKECAEAINVTSYMISSYEKGDNSPSLPELEGLAFFLQVPLEHFWSSDSISKSHRVQYDRSNVTKTIPLRRRIIGAKLRKARQDQDMTMTDLADQVGISTNVLRSYERGEQPIPLPELEVMSAALELPLDTFRDQDGPVGKWFARQEAAQRFLELPPDLQEFIAAPVNQPYLELAQQLSEMSLSKLRTVAESLLEITF